MNVVKTITIKQILNHTSGMPDVEDYKWEKAVDDEGAAEIPELFNSYYVIFAKKERTILVIKSHTSGVTIRSQDL